jgi:AraC family ethanolamine operon transcriptional activator
VFDYANEDIDEFRASIPGFDLDVRQLSRGSFSSKSTLITLPDCTLIYRSVGASISSSCWVPEGATFLFPLDRRGVFIRGRQCGPREQSASLGKHEATCVLPEDFAHLLVIVPMESLRAFLAPAEYSFFVDATSRIESQVIDEELKWNTTQQLMQIFRRLEQGPGLGQEQLLEASTHVINLLYDYLAGHGDVEPYRASNQERILSRALNLIASQPDHVFTLEEMSRGVFASKRAVQYAFSQILGMSPMRVQKLYRLNFVRKELRTAQAPLKFAGILSRHSFSNASRMTREYAELFGERPADTLRRALATECDSSES